MFISMMFKRDSYMRLGTVHPLLTAYNSNPSKENEEKLNEFFLTSGKKGIPLPSGRFGNELGYCLEMQLYNSALYILKNNEKINVELDSVSSQYGGKDIWNAYDCFLFSKTYLSDMLELSESDIIKKYPEIREQLLGNLEAMDELEVSLEKMFSKTKNDNNLFRK